MIKYEIPENWIKYDKDAVSAELVGAKSAVISLRNAPYQLDWVEPLQKMELKREVAGTSKIEGADFTEGELDEAMKESPEELVTRSQRQAQAAVRTYRWIAKIPDDRSIDVKLILEIHANIVTGADDDHCPPGKIRWKDQNVTFGSPRHRGAEGGEECAKAFEALVKQIRGPYKEHDPLIQTLAAHYHLAAMHPFEDGNGRTARALEALMLQRAGLKDVCFIAMSNYYYDEKNNYLKALSDVRAKNFDLTPFLKFCLKGVESQSRRLLTQITKEISKGLYMNMAYDLFSRLKSTRKRVIAERQIEILKFLIKHDDGLLIDIFFSEALRFYTGLKSPHKALVRDLNNLIRLQAITMSDLDVIAKGEPYLVKANLQWPTTISQTDLFKTFQKLPKGKAHSFLR